MRTFLVIAALLFSTSVTASITPERTLVTSHGLYHIVFNSRIGEHVVCKIYTEFWGSPMFVVRDAFGKFANWEYANYGVSEGHCIAYLKNQHDLVFLWTVIPDSYCQENTPTVLDETLLVANNVSLWNDTSSVDCKRITNVPVWE